MAGLVPPVAIAFLGGVPITAQTLGVMLAGVMLGPIRGALAVLLFLFLVALGLPFLSGGRGGLGVFMGPSVGFLIGNPLRRLTNPAMRLWAVALATLGLQHNACDNGSFQKRNLGYAPPGHGAQH